MNRTTALLRNAHIALPDRTARNASILIDDGLIARIVESHKEEEISAGSELDLSGLTLFPGFIDIHIHGAVGVDMMEATADDLRRVSQFLATQGVTGWLPTLVPAAQEDYESSSTAIEQLMHGQMQAESLHSQEGARVLGVHYEGPFVNALQCGALRSEYFNKYSGPADIEFLSTPDAGNAVRMMTLAPEIEGGLNLIQELNNRGWVVSIGHTRADVDVLDGAFKAGAHHLTHFMNAMAPLHHRSPGPVGWGLSRDDVTCDVIADGIHLDPVVLKLLVKLKTSNRLLLISDAIAASGQGDGEYRIWGETIAVKNGRTQNERGSIAGSVITMLQAARMMRSLGVSETDLARMTATNPARLLRVDGDCGSIEEGKRADLIALDDAGDVRLTIIGGRVAFQA
ncbi:MAG: N-acetylglucosamine-6-phosphate deacetylase [Acidobacteriota bacterium]|nr:N-acetylglucosamine-6-phosphate deacetylase [Acidobacteriota bacterium]